MTETFIDMGGVLQCAGFAQTCTGVAAWAELMVNIGDYVPWMVKIWRMRGKWCGL